MKKTLKIFFTVLMVISILSAVPFTAEAASLSAPKNVKAVSVTASDIVVKWSKNSSATGYYVYRSESKNKGYKKIATLNKNKYTSYASQNLKSGKRYYYIVGAYKGKKVKKSKPISCIPVPCKVEYLYLVNRDDTAVELFWHYQNGVTGFKVYRSDSKDGDYKLIATTNKTSYKDSDNINKDKRYYYKVKAYTKYNGKEYKGKYSDIKSIKTDSVYWGGISGKSKYFFHFNADKDVYYGYDDYGYKYYHVYGYTCQPVMIKKAIGDTYKNGRTIKIKYSSSANVTTTIVAKKEDGYFFPKEITTYNSKTKKKKVKKYNKNNYPCLYSFYQEKKGGDYYLSAGGSYVIEDYKTKIPMEICACDDTTIYDMYDDRYLPATQIFDLFNGSSEFIITSENGYVSDIITEVG